MALGCGRTDEALGADATQTVGVPLPTSALGFLRSHGTTSAHLTVDHQLLLEITEGILMSDPEHAEVLLTKIAARDVRIAIDDFGTGYSSLAYLKRFPIHTLKIDHAFVKDLPHSVKDAAICDVVISLANHLNLTTVAEGVEDEQQLQFLAARNCTLIQGFHTGRPMLPEAAMAVLMANTDVIALT